MAGDSYRLNDGDIREVSPDGRTILTMILGYVPEDIHEMRPVYEYRVSDGATGRWLLDLGRYRRRVHRHEWADDGSLHLWIGTVAIRISVAKGEWAFDADGWRPHPLDGDTDAADALLRPHLPEPKRIPAEQVAAGRPAGQRLRDAAWLALFVAMVGYAGWSIATEGWKAWKRPAQTSSTAVNAWLVECPGVSGLSMFSINPDGTLSVPIELSPTALQPTGSDGDWTGLNGIRVRFEGRDAVIVRDGDTIRCRPPAPR